MTGREKLKLINRPHPKPVPRDRPEGGPRVNSGRGGLLATLTALALMASPVRAQTAPLELRLADVGRFASFVDMGSRQPEGSAVRVRVLQVAEADFAVAGEAYWGGWRHEVIDCPARSLAHAGFSSLRATGREGPVMGDRRPAVVPAVGGTDEAVLKVVCDGWKPFAKVPVATSVEEAVTIGRPLIESGAEP